jgi:uncharacterized protein
MSNSEEDLARKSEAFLKQLLLEKLPDDSQVFLFGSRAKGDAGFASDFDIGIVSDNLDPMILVELADIIEESFVPYKVDLVDFSKVDDSFKKQALKKIVIWKKD